ncbi:hypothetical protein AB0958_21700 [Streptomyces sp. NPDC006655]|uniref:hypothetical protein n=1 Tax=Streptomyces sp. NPDC006655 TaxID=3156898 RepID=UPI003453E844
MLLLAVVTLAAVGLLWWASVLHASAGKDFLNAIATGLLVSAAFGVAQSLLTGRVATEVLRSSIVGEVSRSLSTLNNTYYPTNEFEASVEPSVSFNQLLTADLNESSVFWFRGVSARYTAVRLELNRNANVQANLILPDPAVATSIDGRVDYLYRQGVYPGKSVEEIRSTVSRDIRVGLVGLMEACRRCSSIQLILTPTPLLDRYEIFRNAIWVTMFSAKGTGLVFPRTLRFQENSVIYRMQEAECLQTRHHPGVRVLEIPRLSSDREFMDFYEVVTGARISSQGMTELREAYREFASGFRVKADL